MSEENREQAVRRELERVTRELGLSMEPQDWGIVNASAERLGEFCSYYRAHPEMRSELRFEFAELILASANEVLLTGAALDLSAVMELAREDPDAFEDELRYWRGLRGEEFPIAKRL
jgi:hypothetical protein